MRFNSAILNKRAMMLGAMVLLAPLAGCLTTPVSSMVKLSRLTPLDANPADMRFAVRSPHYLRVRNGDISVVISFNTGDPSTSFVETYRPIVNENALPGQGISIGAQDGSRLAIAQFSEADSASMASAQMRVKELRAKGVDGQGSFAVGATGCTQDAVPDGPVLLTTWLRTTPSEDFFVLTRNINLRNVLQKSGQEVSSIPACD